MRTDFEREELSAAFEKAYWERFEVELRAMPCLVMSLRTAVIGHRPPVSLERLSGASSGAGSLGDAQAGTRDVWFEAGWRPTPIYRRERLPAGGEFVGPAIVEQLDTTTVVEPADHVRVDPLGNLVITVRGVA
jgi:N-methylhydantoinase A